MKPWIVKRIGRNVNENVIIYTEIGNYRDVKIEEVDVTQEYVKCIQKSKEGVILSTTYIDTQKITAIKIYGR